MACACSELPSEYGNCALADVADLQHLIALPGSPSPPELQRYRCLDCGQVWEHWRVAVEGEAYPWLVKPGVRSGEDS